MQSTVSAPSVKPPRGDTRVVPTNEVLWIVKSVRDIYAPEIFLESSVIADHICGEIISQVKAAVGGSY